MNTRDATTAFLAARPPAPHGVARQLALNKLLAKVGRRPAERLTIGPYVLQQRVGAGGMGEVYKAIEPSTGQVVALKLLTADGPHARERFEREAAALVSVAHPAVVAYVQHGLTHDGRPWLAMQWVGGSDLGEVLQDGPLSVPRAIDVARQIAQGLAAAHRAGVLHRDVKPSNVMLSGNRATLIDFGIARRLGGDARLTATGMVVGSPAYMAPEQIRGHADARTDVYSLGAVLFEMLTGRPPFAAATTHDQLAAVLSEPAPSVRSFCPDVSLELDALLSRWLAKEPSTRPQGADHALRELAWAIAKAERAEPGLSHRERVLQAVADAAHPTALVGRHRALGAIDGALRDVLEQGEAGLIRVLGPSRSGHTALRRHVGIPAGFPDARSVAAPTLGAAEPFSGIRRLLGAADAEDGPLRAAVANLRDVLEPPPELDPFVHADRVRLAWSSWLDALARRGPILWWVDDADQLDVPSLQLLRLALRWLANHPFALVAHVKTSARLQEQPLRDDRVVDVALRPLSGRLLAQLAERFGVPTDGADGLPGSLFQRSSSNLQVLYRRLSPEPRRVFRAMALAEPAGDLGAVAAVLGIRQTSDALKACVAVLRDQNLVDLNGDGSYSCSGPLRALALDATPPEELSSGRRRVAEWMEVYAPTPHALASLWIGAGEPLSAVPHLLRAARIAISSGAVDEAKKLVAEAEPHASGQLLAELRLLDARVAFWQGRLADAEVRAAAAQREAEAGSARWFDAVAVRITAAGQAGRNGDVAQLVESAWRASSATAYSEKVEALCRGLSQLTAAGLDVDGALLRWLDDADPDRLSASSEAWWHRRHAFALATSNLGAGIRAFISAHRAHLAAGQFRLAAQLRILIGNAYTVTGEFDRADQTLEAARQTIRRLDSDYLSVWQQLARGKLLAEVGTLKDGLACLDAVVASRFASPRLRVGALAWACAAATRHGHPLDALQRLAQMAEFPLSRTTKAIWSALSIRLRHGDVAQHLAEIVDARERNLAFPEFSALMVLAEVEALDQLGRTQDANEAHERALETVRARAGTLGDPIWENKALTGPYHQRELRSWVSSGPAGT